jgi:hypothetical protein
MAIAYRPAREADLERSDWLVVVSIDDLTRRHGFGPMATSRAPITDSYKSFGSGLYAKVFPPLYRTIGNPIFRKTEATSISTRRSTPACSSGGVPIQRIARPTSSNGLSARRLIPPSCKLPCELTISRRSARRIVPREM